MVRKAFTLIELIFAIIVISVAVLSLPVIARVTSETIENNILQEAIFAGSAELMGASAGYWDTNSMQDNSVSHLSRVIDIGSTCENNTSSSRHRLRPGHISQPYHRRCVDSTTATVANDNNATFPSLNSAALGLQSIFIGDPTTQKGYKQDYKSEIVVTLNAANNNIKDIVSTVYEDDGVTPITVLRMQSANIGEIDYYKRRF